jgi:hypothetical protein
MKHSTQNRNPVLQCRPWTTVVLQLLCVSTTVSLDLLCITCAFGGAPTGLSMNAIVASGIKPHHNRAQHCQHGILRAEKRTESYLRPFPLHKAGSAICDISDQIAPTLGQS